MWPLMDVDAALVFCFLYILREKALYIPQKLAVLTSSKYLFGVS